MISRVDALVLYAADLDLTLAFYRALGLPLEPEDHGDGNAHIACELDGVHVAILAGMDGRAPARGVAGSAQIGFQVDSVDDAVAAVAALGSRVLIAAEDAPWGRRAVVEDPDGRAVELNRA